MRFFNPYHFVPIEKGSPETISIQDAGGLLDPRLLRQAPQLTHARYLSSGFFSGRLICRIETEDPICVGAARREGRDGQPNDVSPFEIDGSPAIPASSLRGVVSSIVEAASNSALRVLADTTYSYRKSQEHSYRKSQEQNLSAIGMILQDRGSGSGWSLRPLTIPTLTRVASAHYAEMDARFRGWFPRPNLRVLFADRELAADPGQFPYRTYGTPSAPQFYGLRLNSVSWMDGKEGRLRFDKAALCTNRAALLGVKAVGEGGNALSPMETEPVEWRDDLRDRGYTKSILRVLGSWGERDVVDTRRYEIFIPYDPDEKGWKMFPIPQAVLDKFHAVADERTDARNKGAALPYEPRDTRPGRDHAKGKDRYLRLREGDLVFFRPTSTRKAVGELSLSQIWRERIESTDAITGQPDCPHTTHRFFSECDPELLPFNKGRRTVSLAEQMFGFVEQRKRTEKLDRAALALASRIRFNTALAEPRTDGFYEEGATLRILDSPKPPCPTMYFRPTVAGNAAPSKQTLNPEGYKPQGRKFYLHRQRENTAGSVAEPWKHVPERGEEPKRMEQRSRVRLVKRRTQFFFHIDFDNLTRTELGALIYGLSPTANFRHKIGMGKPIGLGRIRIELAGMYLVDRETRYTPGGYFNRERYGSHWKSLVKPPARYDRERRTSSPELATDNCPDALRKHARDLFVQAHPGIVWALEKIGEMLPEKPVCYPFTSQQRPYAEKDLFEWFKSADPLSPIADATLPTLDSDGH